MTKPTTRNGFRSKDIKERFWGKVNQQENDKCWLWEGSQNGNGYGVFRVDGRQVYAHRLAYQWANGDIPDGKEIDHLCRRSLCVNPSHLEAVTHKVNVLRGNGWSGRHHKATHCVHGHLFDNANTYYYPSGRRGCRTCHREDMKRRRVTNNPSWPLRAIVGLMLEMEENNHGS